MISCSTVTFKLNSIVLHHLILQLLVNFLATEKVRPIYAVPGDLKEAKLEKLFCYLA